VPAADRRGRRAVTPAYDGRVLTAERRPWPWWAEALLVTGVALTTVQEAYIRAGGTLLHPFVAAAAAASLALVLRHRFLLLVVAVALVAAAVLGAVLPLLVVVFQLASAGWWLRAVVCWAVAMGGNLAFQPERNLWAMRSFGPLTLPVLAVVLGLWARSRQRLSDSLTEQARLQERARIASEMHDVLAHHLTVLALHAGALQQRAHALPAPVADRIALLRATSTEALGDLRDVLGTLQGDDARRVPAVRGLSVLLDEARASGQVIRSEIGGDAEGTPVGHRLALERVVQEALTNARKHASGAPVRVTVSYGPPVSTVEIHNAAGTPSAAVPSGYGLVGLTERVVALGGSLRYGRVGSGGWLLTATIPVTDRSAPA
jgi:signal transduction histidine kinase